MVDAVQVTLDGGRVQVDDLGRGIDAEEIVTQLRLFRLEAAERGGAGVVGENALHQQVHRALVFAGNRGEALLDRAAAADAVGGEGAAGVVVGLDIEREGLAGAEPRLETLHDLGLDVLDIKGSRVGAGVPFLGSRAHDATAAAGLVLDRHAGAAAAAFQKARQQPLGLALLPLRLGANLPHNRLHLVEQVALDDRQLRRLGILPFLLRVDPRHALAGVRVLDHTHAVPDDGAGIDRVDEDAMAALAVAVQGARQPVLAARRADAFGVKIGTDGAGGAARRAFGKDAAHDFGFVFDDLKLAGLSRYRPIAIGAAAGVAAIARDAFHATSHLVREILQIERADQAADADLHLVGPAVVHRQDFNAGEAEALVDAGEILLVAAEAIERLDDQYVEGAGAGRLHHAEKAVATHDRGAGAGTIVELGDDAVPCGQSMPPAERDLVLDGAVALQVG